MKKRANTDLHKSTKAGFACQLHDKRKVKGNMILHVHLNADAHKHKTPSPKLTPEATVAE